MYLTKAQNALVTSLAAGIFVGAALFDVFPEASARLGSTIAITWMAAGLLFWWLQKHVLRRFQKPDMPPLVASALWFHSILEGIVTGLAFGVSQTFGILVLAAMTLHLLPEFFAAVGLMRGAGSKTRTSVAVTIAGFVILYLSFGLTYVFVPQLDPTTLPALIALSGGAFLYVGCVSFWRLRGARTLVAFMIGAAIAFLTA
ncbi:hypothetical protein A3E39_04360 [Candidatus Uhrbacteria bacterium RIFCSPHIGHO2_12_FULL_60_25]|uniref:ZIP family metal transporter n=1 Tax=Candidatus Uhrbacteria bacterium RIFCSPHIGHO2_12_FULL_60_25 TaxID=1802399 RepID=A0A1F7UIK5_9BACT|nr:MAG: hypothetical protein A3D73_00910 [Candidatus Uhrbacteria bacterium RIFCSPHIGHO2_02_FULL_60_44]OGL78120.1 MAG: hypothetical protein A3E39_04360 [Candidatus Uhrbacteria bacterium RIFCSPHIGHO2_12_FULL_60_25]